ncbi:MAG: nucleoside-diphosphate kinase [Planctomycetes bacterium]|jgi:nucleoside-diphosphate kinase|nr:nucleoside-diphosphate kinase [Planctomycetota bacterium]
MQTGFERTLVLLKPDAVQRRLIGRILQRFEQKGLAIVALKLVQVTDALAREQYAVHEGKEFYEPLVKFLTSSPIVACALEGVEAIATARKLMGATFGRDAQPGTIRGDFGISKRYNLIHGSDSPETAEFEIGLYFSPSEILDYRPSDLPWVYDLNGPEPV